MIPGELFTDGPRASSSTPGRATLTLAVANTGDRPIQVGSHYHFAETNAALAFDRHAARGTRLEHPQRHGGALRARAAAHRGTGRLRRTAAAGSSAFNGLWCQCGEAALRGRRL